MSKPAAVHYNNHVRVLVLFGEHVSSILWLARHWGVGARADVRKTRNSWKMQGLEAGDEYFLFRGRQD